MGVSLCYTLAAMDDKTLAGIIAHLQHWGIDGMAAAFLEHGGPLIWLTAQMLYVATPLLPGDRTVALAQLLENPEALRTVVAQLTEKPQPCPR